MPGTDLEHALAGARRGDEASVAVLYRSLQPGLRRYLARRAPGVEDDLASETWLAVARQLPRLEGGVEALRILLYTVARRRVADHFRRARRAPRPGAADAIGAATTEGADETALDAIAAEHAIALLTALLPPLQAEVVLLRVVGDLSVDDVARVLDRSPGAIRVLQHRALRRLAQHPSGFAVTD